MSSLTRDDAVLEPYADLPAMALAVIGFTVFMAIITQAYNAYSEKAYISSYYEDAVSLAEKLSKDSLLTRNSMLDAEKLESLTIPEIKELTRKYGAYGFKLEVQAIAGEHSYRKVIKDPDMFEPRLGVSASIPITLKLNEAQAAPGILAVKIWRRV